MKPIQPDLKFDERTHTYTWKGRVVPSVTQVLSRVGVRVKMPELQGEDVNYRGEWIPVGFDDRWLQDDSAAQFGSAFHKVAAALLDGKNVKFPEEMGAWVGQFLNFVKEFNGLDIVEYEGERLVECPLYSEKYGYCGTFDAVGMTKAKNGKDVYVYDWKTSTGKESFWGMQLAAYAQLIYENLPYMNIYGTVVRFSEDKYQIIPVTGKFDEYMLPEFNDFRSCLNVYKMVRGD